MPSMRNVSIHQSQFPDRIRAELFRSLRRRQVNHRFHYDTVDQAQKWIALARRYAPFFNQADARSVYASAFATAARLARSPHIQLIGLGCGEGSKDQALLRKLRQPGRRLSYFPCDVSVPLVIAAAENAAPFLAREACLPIVCDLLNLPVSGQLWRTGRSRRAMRILTLFGMIPNFEPRLILPKLAGLLRSGDLLLLSANLAPGADYADGVKKVLPLYDNPATRQWLETFLFSLGVSPRDGATRFSMERNRDGYWRICADYRFSRRKVIAIDRKEFRFQPGDRVRLFFSYRYTPAGMEALLRRYRLKVCDCRVTASGEEAVYLCRR